MKFTIMGYTVETAEQARTIYLMAALKGDEVVKKQAAAVISKFEAN